MGSNGLWTEERSKSYISTVWLIMFLYIYNVFDLIELNFSES